MPDYTVCLIFRQNSSGSSFDCLAGKLNDQMNLDLKGKRDPQPLLLVNVGQLVTLRCLGRSGPRRGAELRELGIVNDAAVLCLGGKVVSVGRTKDALRDPWLKKHRKRVIEIDCAGQVVLPGFVDSHTHPAFMNPRLVDFEKRSAGATYEEIAEAGGGIRSSVEPVREAGKSALADKVLDALHEMAEQGTTTVEAKSGYGLTLDAELKSLAAIRQAAKQWPGTVITTLLGAHVVPQEFRDRSPKYVELICSEMIPRAARRKLAQFVDVFCDRGAFTEQETAAIFAAALENGLEVRAHLGQLAAPGSGFIKSIVNSCHPASLDHMDHVTDEGIAMLAKSDTVATFVPGANYFLGLEKYPAARKFIDAGVPVALATDYNPGSSPTASMPFVMSLACTHMKMSPAEAVAAATINGACALRVENCKGSIEPGKDADLAVLEVEDYREIPYWFASNRCALTVLNGVLVASGGSGELG
jgi:imidazolonepropionase